MSASSGTVQGVVGNLMVAGDVSASNFALNGFPVPLYGQNDAIVAVGARTMGLIGPFNNAGILSVVVNTSKSVPLNGDNVYASGVFHVFYDNFSEINCIPMSLTHTNFLTWDLGLSQFPAYLDVTNTSTAPVSLTAVWSFLSSRS